MLTASLLSHEHFIAKTKKGFLLSKILTGQDFNTWVSKDTNTTALLARDNQWPLLVEIAEAGHLTPDACNYPDNLHMYTPVAEFLIKAVFTQSPEDRVAAINFASELINHRIQFAVPQKQPDDHSSEVIPVNYVTFDSRTSKPPKSFPFAPGRLRAPIDFLPYPFRSSNFAPSPFFVPSPSPLTLEEGLALSAVGCRAPKVSSSISKSRTSEAISIRKFNIWFNKFRPPDPME